MGVDVVALSATIRAKVSTMHVSCMHCVGHSFRDSLMSSTNSPRLASIVPIVSIVFERVERVKRVNRADAVSVDAGMDAASSRYLLVDMSFVDMSFVVLCCGAEDCPGPHAFAS